MNKNTKAGLLLLSFALLGGGLGAVRAQVNVKSDLSNAIQNIQKVYFSPGGIKDPDPTKNILMEAKDGIVRVNGKLIIENPNAQNNTVEKSLPNALVLQGQENQIQGTDAILIGGKGNIIKSSSTDGLITAGLNNNIEA